MPRAETEWQITLVEVTQEDVPHAELPIVMLAVGFDVPKLDPDTDKVLPAVVAALVVRMIERTGESKVRARTLVPTTAAIVTLSDAE